MFGVPSIRKTITDKDTDSRRAVREHTRAQPEMLCGVCACVFVCGMSVVGTSAASIEEDNALATWS